MLRLNAIWLIPVALCGGSFSSAPAKASEQTTYIATAKAVRTQNVRRVQWHLVNNQTDLVFCGFDFSAKTSISQCC